MGRGGSVVETVIITAIFAALAIAVGAIIVAKVTAKTNSINLNWTSDRTDDFAVPRRTGATNGDRSCPDAPALDARLSGADLDDRGSMIVEAMLVIPVLMCSS